MSPVPSLLRHCLPWQESKDAFGTIVLFPAFVFVQKRKLRTKQSLAWMWCVFCSSCLTQSFAWKWLKVPELGPLTYSNLAGFCSESIIQSQDRWCISGFEQRRESEVPRAPSSCLSQHLGLRQAGWRREAKLIKHGSSSRWWHGIIPPFPLWRKGTKACETYAEITMLCQLQWAGSCCSAWSVNTLYCAGKMWGLAILVCLLLNLPTSRSVT